MDGWILQTEITVRKTLGKRDLTMTAAPKEETVSEVASGQFIQGSSQAERWKRTPSLLSLQQ